MSIAASEQPNVRPVVLAEIQVAMAMRGAIWESSTPVAIHIVKEGAVETHIVKEGDSIHIAKES